VFALRGIDLTQLESPDSRPAVEYMFYAISRWEATSCAAPGADAPRGVRQEPAHARKLQGFTREKGETSPDSGLRTQVREAVPEP